MTVIPGWDHTASTFNHLADVLMDLLTMDNGSSARLEAQTAAIEHAATISERVPHATAPMCMAIAAAINHKDEHTRRLLKESFEIAHTWHHEGKETPHEPQKLLTV